MSGLIKLDREHDSEAALHAFKAAADGVLLETALAGDGERAEVLRRCFLARCRMTC